MKVIIFNSQRSFNGVIYNIAKVSNDRAEFMCAENFHALGILRTIMPQDYIDYLMSISAASNIKKPQFHAVISCEHEKKNKRELTDIAKQWLQKLGYGAQPYLIFFHYDTRVNHVHIVSCRVNWNGKGITSSFEVFRAYNHLNEILGIDPKKKALQDSIKALSYKYSSRMEFIILLYSMGYNCKIKNNFLSLIRYGRVQNEVSLEKIYTNITPYDRSSKRELELKEIFSENLHKYNTTIHKKKYLKNFKLSSPPIICTSEFIMMLKNNYNIQLIFHGNNRLLPTHYSIIDHHSKAIFEGSEICSIAEFIRPVNYKTITDNIFELDTNKIQMEDIDYGFKDTTGVSIGDFNIEIYEENDPQVLKQRRKNKKPISQ
ncbi:relaxase/mobilization nuclease domain-containing protein [Sphingobacterium bovistauri]|uniref:Relaxase/mobilization nuclease domain-containing protein n=1 Tax=Sphingobacterium bovistauri TaxID=2781959 RepID=A0ABS7Z1P4_9SPHI|nr:relaxase/mobilization nuclease domain-containing protein [Sphingobacterium bovistauri]MCA5004051.1 relaxase/mobilization nuclease domain-containing protein [Sphingobacterium bovistauri]